MILKVNLGTAQAPNWVPLEAVNSKLIDGRTIDEVVEESVKQATETTQYLVNNFIDLSIIDGGEF